MTGTVSSRESPQNVRIRRCVVVQTRTLAVVELGLQALQDLPCQPSGLRRGLAHLYAGGLEGLLLRLRGARRTGHNRARVTHRLALGRGESRDVADDRFGHVGL